MANEPCKITVRDDLENGIQKYAELCAVITEKQSTIQDVIDCGRELASKAQSKALVANSFRFKSCISRIIILCLILTC